MTSLLYLARTTSAASPSEPAFRELGPALREAFASGAVAVAESAVLERESRPQRDLGLLDLLRGLSGGGRLPPEPDEAAREDRWRMEWTIEHEHPARRTRPSDAADLEGLAIASGAATW